MRDPEIFGLPLSLAFLYFIVYAVLGWCLETTFCSIKERRLVSRGFLYGPLCPIYGVGALMMILWFQPLMGNPFLFFLVSTVCMSAWEYLVGWALETTTHIKYWDYSEFPFNLHGRICLWVCLTWGVLSFLVLYFLHPAVVSRLAGLRGEGLFFVDGVLLGILLADSAATIYQLARASEVLAKLQQTGDLLRVRATLGRYELSDRMDLVRDRLEDLMPDQLDEVGRALKERYDALLSRAEYDTRRVRFTYRDMKSTLPGNRTLESVRRRGSQIKARLSETRKNG